MLAHIFCQYTKADAGEVVDGEARLAGVVQREEALEAGAQNFVRGQSLLELREAEVLD